MPIPDEYEEMDFAVIDKACFAEFTSLEDTASLRNALKNVSEEDLDKSLF